MDTYDFERILKENKNKIICFKDDGQNMAIEWFQDSWAIWVMNCRLTMLFDRIECTAANNADLFFKGVCVANIDTSRLEVIE